MSISEIMLYSVIGILGRTLFCFKNIGTTNAVSETLSDVNNSNAQRCQQLKHSAVSTNQILSGVRNSNTQQCQKLKHSAVSETQTLRSARNADTQQCQ